MKKSFLNIEFIFMLFLGIVMLIAFSISILSITIFDKEDPYKAFSEFGIMLYTLISIFYLLFFIWQVKLWKGFKNKNNRKWIQQSIIFTFSILPLLPFLIIYIIQYILTVMDYLNLL